MKNKKIILSIGKLSGNESAGVNINIPKYVKYLNNICVSGYLDCGNERLKRFDNFENFFRINQFNDFSIKKLPVPFNKPDIVVFQTLYVPEFLKIAKELIRLDIPYTIIPRCSMTKAAQKKKKIKKKIGNICFFNSFIKKAKFIHFLTKNEYLESKKCFKFNNYVIIGNGIEMPNKYNENHKKNEYNVNYIGRIDVYHKGLDILIDAINIDREFFIDKNINVNLFGPNYENGVEILKRRIETNNLNSIVNIYDGVYGLEKEKVLLNTDVFIQTSRLEGHPTGVIEAISYGIPVIVTPGTNMCDVVFENKLGFVCDFNAKSIFANIKKSYDLKEDFKTISNNCISYARKNFDWQKICKTIIDEYFK